MAGLGSLGMEQPPTPKCYNPVNIITGPVNFFPRRPSERKCSVNHARAVAVPGRVLSAGWVFELRKAQLLSFSLWTETDVIASWAEEAHGAHLKMASARAQPWAGGGPRSPSANTGHVLLPPISQGNWAQLLPPNMVTILYFQSEWPDSSPNLLI